MKKCFVCLAVQKCAENAEPGCAHTPRILAFVHRMALLHLAQNFEVQRLERDDVSIESIARLCPHHGQHALRINEAMYAVEERFLTELDA